MPPSSSSSVSFVSLPQVSDFTYFFLFFLSHCAQAEGAACPSCLLLVREVCPSLSSICLVWDSSSLLFLVNQLDQLRAELSTKNEELRKKTDEVILLKTETETLRGQINTLKRELLQSKSVSLWSARTATQNTNSLFLQGSHI